MEKYEKPVMEVIEIEEEMKTFPGGLPGCGHGETDDSSVPNG